MKIHELLKAIDGKLLSIPLSKRVFLISLLTILVVLKIALLIISQVEEERKFNEIYAVLPISNRDFSWFFIHLRMTIALLTGTIAIWLWKAERFLVLVISLVWIVVEYWIWYSRSLANEKRFNVDPDALQKPGVADFYTGTWWDLVFLVLILVIFAWTIKILISSLLAAANEFKSDQIGRPES